MTETLLARCELFARNLEMMKEGFRWEVSQLYPLCANIYTEKGIELNTGGIKTAKGIIKDNTSFFSNFRGLTTTITLATLLSVEDSPKDSFNQVVTVYNILKEVFSSSAYLTLTAYLIVKSTSPENYEDITNRTRKIYDMIKKEHFFLTSSEDCITAVQFALSGYSENEIVSKSEKCFELLKPEISHGNTVQTISNILALSNKSCEELTSKTMQIINNLKSHGYKLTSGVELSVFAALAVTDIEVSRIVNDILEVNAYLLTVKGFGNLLTGSKLMDPKLLPKRRLMHSALIVMNEYCSLSEADDSLDEAEVEVITNAQTMAALNMLISIGPSNA